jgi:hypothetical protein
MGGRSYKVESYNVVRGELLGRGAETLRTYEGRNKKLPQGK